MLSMQPETGSLRDARSRPHDRSVTLAPGMFLLQRKRYADDRHSGRYFVQFSTLNGLTVGGRNQLSGDRNGWDEENDRAQHPHESAGGILIGQRAQTERPRDFAVAGIEQAARKTEKRGDPGVHEIGEQKIRDQYPALGNGPRRPGRDDRPPEEEARREEAEMLEVVPVLRAQRKLVRSRYVPPHERNVHRDPGDSGTNEESRYLAKESRAKERAQHWPHEPGGQSAQHRYNRRAQQDERRSSGDKHIV